MNDEQGRLDGNATVPTSGAISAHAPSVGQQWIQEGLQLLEQGDRAGAAQVLVRARSERDTLLQAHALIESHDLVGSFRNIMGRLAYSVRVDAAARSRRPAFAADA
jgi:hypothetical protein